MNEFIKELLGDTESVKIKQMRKKANKSFWEYCKARDPSFYKDSRFYLKELCDTLQALAEGRIIRTDKNAGWYIVPKHTPIPPDAEINRNFILNLPPRHGKSYTLTLLSQWLFGVDNDTKIITVSYNEILAERFSKAVRDGIEATKIDKDKIIFSDIFPDVHITKGDGAKKLWSLDGKYFSYLGTGFGGTMTGIGCNVGIIDDPIKNAEEAFNENVLDKQWSWYTDTFLSRVEQGGIQIINMTRWAKKDICGRLLSGETADKWYVMRKAACADEEKGLMLCDELLSFDEYLNKRKITSPEIFLANFKQEPIDLIGRLYEEFKTYKTVPVFDGIFAYCDTADTGADYLCMIVFGVCREEAYVTDIVFTKKPMEITEQLVADALESNKVNRCRIEANSGGRGFARNVQRLLKTNYTSITTFTQTKNKQSRILTQSAWVQQHIYYPENWRERWSEFAESMQTYLRSGKNKHDDAQDAITGVAETVQMIWR